MLICVSVLMLDLNWPSVMADVNNGSDNAMNIVHKADWPEDWNDENGNTYWLMWEDTVSMVKSAEPKSDDATLIIPDTIEHNGKVYKVTYAGDGRYCNEYDETYPVVGKGYKKIVYGKNVKNVSNGVHKGNKTLEEVTFEGDDIAVADYAFSGCENLKKVNGFNKIKSFAEFSFSSTSLTLLNFGKKVERIGESAFSRMRELKKVTMPKNISVIGEFAFARCKKLEKVNISNGVKYIGSSAFMDCKNLKKVKIPESVKNISGDAFWYCNPKIKVKISKKNKKYCVAGNNILSKNKKSLVAMLRVPRTVVIPVYICKVKNYAISFYSNVKTGKKLKAVVAKGKNLKFADYAYPGKIVAYYYPAGGKKIKMKNKPKRQYQYATVKIKNGKVKYKK